MRLIIDILRLAVYIGLVCFMLWISVSGDIFLLALVVCIAMPYIIKAVMPEEGIKTKIKKEV